MCHFAPPAPISPTPAAWPHPRPTTAPLAPSPKVPPPSVYKGASCRLSISDLPMLSSTMKGELSSPKSQADNSDVAPPLTIEF